MEKFLFTVSENEGKMRLDKFLAEKFLPTKPEITRSKIKKLIDDKNVFNSDGSCLSDASQKIKIGDIITISLEKTKPHHLEAKEIPFKIIYEDDDLILIDKPAGLTVHPGAGNQNNTLVNALLFTHKNKLSTISGEFRPGIVHRLDKDTSGLMLVAKNDFAHQALSKGLQERDIKRSYVAFVYGVLSPKQGSINKNIARSKTNRVKMAITKNQGRKAITHYRTKEILYDGFISLVECSLETGRTHQIRVHMESMNHSLIGDKVYCGSRKITPKELNQETSQLVTNFSRQALHSYKISFLHPRSQEELRFEIELPEDLQKLYDSISSAGANTEPEIIVQKSKVIKSRHKTDLRKIIN